MNSLSGKHILILQQRGWAVTIGHPLAKRLHEEGCKLAALTLKRSTHRYIISQKDVPYELIINNDEIMSEPEKFLKPQPPSLIDVCQGLGIDTIWPIANSLRNHVRSYKDQWYYAFHQNVSDQGITAYILATYSYIERIFQEFKPDVIIGPNFVALPQIMLSLYAKKHGVQMIGVTDTKIRDWFMFGHDHQDSKGPVFDRLADLNNNNTESHNRENAKKYIHEFRENFKMPAYATQKPKLSLYKRLRHELSPYRDIWYWYTKPNINKLKSTGITLDCRPPYYILRDFYAEKYYRFTTEHLKYHPLEYIGKFAYFPLQFQPEATIDVIAPYFNNQIEAARLVAMSLPDDYTLVVKEHPAMVGLRRPSYLKKLIRTPNVKLVDFRIPSDAMIKKADIIISPSGTTIAEAAFYNKPAIQLGDLGTTQCFPNVLKHTDLTTLSAAIKKHLSADMHSDIYERRLENYVAAVFDAGFKYNYAKTWEEGDVRIDTLMDLFVNETKRCLV